MVVGEEVGTALAPLFVRDGRVFFGVVDVPEGDDEAVFGLDFEFFDVETDASGVVADVAD